MDWKEICHGALLLLAIVNPVGNVPLYVHLTDGMDRSRQLRILNGAALTALVMVVLFALLGDWTLRALFELTITEFKISGGLLLFMIAARGVLNSGPRYRPGDHEERFLALFPLAFPIMVGPGSLVLTIILSQRNGAWGMTLSALLCFVVVFIVANCAHRIMRFFGPYAGMVIARLLYLFLAGKAVSMVLHGLVEFGRQVK